MLCTIPEKSLDRMHKQAELKFIFLYPGKRPNAMIRSKMFSTWYVITALSFLVSTSIPPVQQVQGAWYLYVRSAVALCWLSCIVQVRYKALQHIEAFLKHTNTIKWNLKM
jgi:hypothetical protein